MATKINDSFIDELVKNCKTADDVVGSNGIPSIRQYPKYGKRTGN